LARKTKPDVSEELSENVILDLDKKGHIVGIEVLDALKNIRKDNELSVKNSGAFLFL
jgi:uncharacterized protein YuzE